MPEEWLQYAFGSGGSSAVRYAVTFAVIFAVLSAVALVGRRLARRRRLPETPVGQAGRQPRLGIVDVYEMDSQRQLILLRRDDVEHLLLVGGPNDVVVECNIQRVAVSRTEPFAEIPAPSRERLPAPPPAPGRADAPGPRKEPSFPQAPPPASVPAPPTDAPTARPGTAPTPKPDPKPVPGQRPRATLTSTGPAIAPGPKPTADKPAGDKAPGEQRRVSPEILSDMASQLEAALAKPMSPPAAGPAPEVDTAKRKPSDPVRDAGKADAEAKPPSGVEAPPAPAGKGGEPPSAGKPSPDEAAARPSTPATLPARTSELPKDGPREAQPTKTVQNPFSVEEIEVEFARLLGRKDTGG